jgi:hypothetical protein
MKYKFCVKDIPLEYNIWNYILKNTDIESHYKMKSTIDSSDIISLEHGFDIPSIISSVKEMQENSNEMKFNTPFLISEENF